MRRAVVVIAILIIALSMETIPQSLTVQANPYGEPVLYPDILISNPQQEAYMIYYNTTIPLSIRIRVPVNYQQIGSVYYNLDNGPNKSLPLNFESQILVYGATDVLLNVSEGRHTLKAFTNELFTQQTFMVDTTYRDPTITMLCPQNQTYDSEVMPLSFYINASIFDACYIIDSNPTYETNRTGFSGNTTLGSLSNGPHNVTVCLHVQSSKYYQNRYIEQTTYFTVDTKIASDNHVSTIALAVDSVVIFVVVSIVVFRTRKISK